MAPKLEQIKIKNIELQNKTQIQTNDFLHNI